MSQGPYKIALIVEGYGEINAVPNLVSRWVITQGLDNFYPHKQVVCAYDSDKLKRNIEHFVRLAMANQPDAILVIVDADRKEKGIGGKPGKLDCPAELGPKLLSRAQVVCPHIPVGIVLAYKEYEAWFLHILPELQTAGEIPADIVLPIFNSDEDTPRGSKERLEEIMGRKYNERRDQLNLTRHLPTIGPLADEMKSHSRSYLHLLTTLERLVREVRNLEA